MTLSIDARALLIDSVQQGIADGSLAIGEAVKRLRVEGAGLHQSQYARMCKISVRTLIQIEQGEGTFAALPCFNLPLDFKRVLEMSASDWRTFTKSCLDALRLGKGRRWVSNVELPAGPEAARSRSAARSQS